MRNIFCDGDSITEGNHLATYTENWVYKLAERIGMVTNISETSITGQEAPATTANTFTMSIENKVWNVAVGGSTSGATNNRWTANVGSRIKAGDTYLLLVGVNDIALGVTNPTIKANITAIKTKVESYGALFIPCTLTPWGNATAPQLVQYNELNTWIRTLVRFQDFEGANPDNDGVHPSAAGCTTLANAVALTQIFAPVVSSAVMVRSEDNTWKSAEMLLRDPSEWLSTGLDLK